MKNGQALQEPLETPDLSLVVACYHEAEHLEESLPRLVEVLDYSDLTYELIFVDDASQDETPAIVAGLCEGHANRRAVYHQLNRGRGATVTEGMRLAKGTVVGFLDIDLEVHPLYVPHFVREILSGRCDGVIGDRVYFINFSLTTLFRAILSRGYRKMVHAVFQPPVRDTEAGYKFFRRDRILPILDQCRDTGWFWDTEIVLRAHAAGLHLTQIPCAFVRRLDKTSTVRVVRDTYEYAKALWGYRQRERLARDGSRLYRRPWLHNLALRFLYGGRCSERFTVVAPRIEDGDSVVELCAGEGLLYREHLDGRVSEYKGYDLSRASVELGRRHSAPLEHADIRVLEIPKADTVVMMGSLYQFLPDARTVLDRMVAAARRRVILTEPVHNRSQGGGLSAWVAGYLTETEDNRGERFDEERLRALMDGHTILHWERVAGGREVLAVVEGKAKRGN